MQALYWAAVVKKELSRKGKLSVKRSLGDPDTWADMTHQEFHAIILKYRIGLLGWIVAEPQELGPQQPYCWWFAVGYIRYKPKIYAIAGTAAGSIWQDITVFFLKRKTANGENHTIQSNPHWVESVSSCCCWICIGVLLGLGQKKHSFLWSCLAWIGIAWGFRTLDHKPKDNWS